MQAPKNGNWFQAKGSLATKRILNRRAAKLLNKQQCRRNHAGAFLLQRLQAEYAVFQFPDRVLSRSNPDRALHSERLQDGALGARCGP